MRSIGVKPTAALRPPREPKSFAPHVILHRPMRPYSRVFEFTCGTDAHVHPPCCLCSSDALCNVYTLMSFLWVPPLPPPSPRRIERFVLHIIQHITGIQMTQSTGRHIIRTSVYNCCDNAFYEPDRHCGGVKQKTPGDWCMMRIKDLSFAIMRMPSEVFIISLKIILKKT